MSQHQQNDGLSSRDSIQKVINDQLKTLSGTQYEIVVIGNTNAGKSTFLRHMTKMKGYFNTSVIRETACVWRYKISQDKGPFKLTKIFEEIK